MKLGTYLELRGEIRNFMYGCQSEVDSKEDESIDEYRSRVHKELDEIFNRIKEKEKERKDKHDR